MDKFIDEVDLFVENNLDVCAELYEEVALYNKTYGTTYGLMEYFEMRGSTLVPI